jgi:REP element-mobilizing transposase RayT
VSFVKSGKISAIDVANANGRGYKKDMARAQKRHIQQDLRFPNRAGNLRGTTQERGRKRRKGGRKAPPGQRPSEPHKTREAFRPSEPVHVTMRVVDAIGRLRMRATYQAVREAMFVVYPREDCRIVHLSIQDNHLHVLVEADGRTALARGMQAFQISAAKHINAAVSSAGSWWERRHMRTRPKRRKGQVFADRYHVEVIRSPKQARNTLAYVLNNWRRHREHRSEVARTWLIDPFSTGWSFDGWKERENEPFVWKLRASYQPILSWRPRTWLLTEGWRRWGLVSVREVPGPRADARAMSGYCGRTHQRA